MEVKLTPGSLNSVHWATHPQGLTCAERQASGAWEDLFPGFLFCALLTQTLPNPRWPHDPLRPLCMVGHITLFHFCSTLSPFLKSLTGEDDDLSRNTHLYVGFKKGRDGRRRRSALHGGWGREMGFRLGKAPPQLGSISSHCSPPPQLPPPAVSIQCSPNSSD